MTSLRTSAREASRILTTFCGDMFLNESTRTYVNITGLTWESPGDHDKHVFTAVLLAELFLSFVVVIIEPCLPASHVYTGREIFFNCLLEHPFSICLKPQFYVILPQFGHSCFAIF